MGGTQTDIATIKITATEVLLLLLLLIIKIK